MGNWDCSPTCRGYNSINLKLLGAHLVYRVHKFGQISSWRFTASRNMPEDWDDEKITTVFGEFGEASW